MFKTLQSLEISKLADVLQDRKMAEGEAIVTEGEQGDTTAGRASSRAKYL